MKLPQTSDEEKEARDKAMQDGLKKAVQVSRLPRLLNLNCSACWIFRKVFFCSPLLLVKLLGDSLPEMDTSTTNFHQAVSFVWKSPLAVSYSRTVLDQCCPTSAYEWKLVYQHGTVLCWFSQFWLELLKYPLADEKPILKHQLCTNFKFSIS